MDRAKIVLTLYSVVFDGLIPFSSRMLEDRRKGLDYKFTAKMQLLVILHMKGNRLENPSWLIDFCDCDIKFWQIHAQVCTHAIDDWAVHCYKVIDLLNTNLEWIRWNDNTVMFWQTHGDHRNSVQRPTMAPQRPRYVNKSTVNAYLSFDVSLTLLCLIWSTGSSFQWKTRLSKQAKKCKTDIEMRERAFSV